MKFNIRLTAEQMKRVQAALFAPYAMAHDAYTGHRDACPNCTAGVLHDTVCKEGQMFADALVNAGRLIDEFNINMK